MKVNLPNWLWMLIILQGVSVVLLVGVKFGGWMLPGGLEYLASPLSSIMTTAALLGFGLWEKKREEKP